MGGARKRTRRRTCDASLAGTIPESTQVQHALVRVAEVAAAGGRPVVSSACHGGALSDNQMFDGKRMLITMKDAAVQQQRTKPRQTARRRSRSVYENAATATPARATSLVRQGCLSRRSTTAGSRTLLDDALGRCFRRGTSVSRHIRSTPAPPVGRTGLAASEATVDSFERIPCRVCVWSHTLSG